MGNEFLIQRNIVHCGAKQNRHFTKWTELSGCIVASYSEQQISVLSIVFHGVFHVL